MAAKAAGPVRCRRLSHDSARRLGRCQAARATKASFSQASFSFYSVSSYFTRNMLDVSITSGPAAGLVSSSASASFAFAATASGARFECSLDSHAYSTCTSPHSLTGLSNGTHTFSVYAVDYGVQSRAATRGWQVSVAATAAPKRVVLPVSVTTDTTAPSTPTGLVATAGNGQVVLTWKASTDNAGVTGYWVLRNGTALTQVTTTKFTDSSVVNGTTYSYAVEAYDAAGNLSVDSAAVTAEPLAPVVPAPTVVTTTTPPPPVSGGNPPAPLTAWVPAHSGLYTPLSDAQAAADVTPEPENRPANTPENNTMPTSGQLQTFYNTLNSNGQTVVAANPYDQFVTGHYTGTTDDIIQWAAWKWGIPADWLRAEYVQESNWNMSQLGDEATVTSTQYAQYPAVARVPGTDEVYQSMGISQVKWIPDGSVGAGTEPMRWQSTAFNVDYQAAQIRFYYDNPDGLRSAWGDSSYSPGNAWDSLGGWYSPFPWLNSGQLAYVAEVQGHLAARTWAQPGF